MSYEIIEVEQSAGKEAIVDVCNVAVIDGKRVVSVTSRGGGLGGWYVVIEVGA
jgi:hypothetical protein